MRCEKSKIGWSFEWCIYLKDEIRKKGIRQLSNPFSF